MEFTQIEAKCLRLLLSRNMKSNLYRMSCFILILQLFFVSGCLKSSPTAPNPISVIVAPKFTDVTYSAGINWKHNPCRTGKKFLPETVGGGGGFIDFNNDNLLDIIMINGGPLPGYKGSPPHLALYKNLGNGSFVEVSHEVGLDFNGYGIGLATGSGNRVGTMLK